MAYRYPPQNQYGAPYVPAVPTQSLLAHVLGITALGLCVTALAAWLSQGFVTPGLGLVAMLVGFVLLLAINATRRNEPLSAKSQRGAPESRKASSKRRARR